MANIICCQIIPDSSHTMNSSRQRKAGEGSHSFDSKLFVLFYFFIFKNLTCLPRCPEPARGVPPVAKVMRLRGLTGKGESGLKGASFWICSCICPKKQSLPALLHYAFTYSSDINRGYPQPPFSN